MIKIRKCRNCGDELDASRYFNCKECVLPYDDVFNRRPKPSQMDVIRAAIVKDQLRDGTRAENKGNPCFPKYGFATLLRTQ